MEKFSSEVKALSNDDIEIILSDQGDLYSDEEVEILSNELVRRREEAEIIRISKIPDIIKCLKCDGPISKLEKECPFCEAKIDISKIQFNLIEDEKDDCERSTASKIVFGTWLTNGLGISVFGAMAFLVGVSDKGLSTDGGHSYMMEPSQLMTLGGVVLAAGVLCIGIGINLTKK
ncbi:MAG: hypothetical protein FWH04_02195 [Oscillospiraceae bacterium]|nr:hypothetical protein [Oscillospiraceae bacterium]